MCIVNGDLASCSLHGYTLVPFFFFDKSMFASFII